MSKNIEEIVDEVLPSNSVPVNHGQADFAASMGYYQANQYARERIKQAITEKKLCLPMSVDQLVVELNKFIISAQGKSIASNREIAEHLYQAQFGGNK